MPSYIMALDAGTTSNRCILFDRAGHVCSMAQKEFTQFFPKPGWVEHDAEEIWSVQLEGLSDLFTVVQISVLGKRLKKRLDNMVQDNIIDAD